MTKDHDELLQILDNLSPGPNWRVILDSDYGVLVLTVQEREPWAIEAFGRVLLRGAGNWETQRVLRAPTYAALLQMVKLWPEFLQPRLEW